MAERKIGGQTYKVEPLVASEAIELYAALIAAVGSASGKLPAIILSLTTGEEEGKIMADVAALSALADIVRSNGADGIRNLVRRIVEIARVQAPSGEWRQVDLDGDFTGELGKLLPVAKFVIEEQFRDFFTGNAGSGILGMLQEALRQRK